MDKRKVIKGLECCIKQAENDVYCKDLDCPYYEKADSCRLVCWTNLNKDALVILKTMCDEDTVCHCNVKQNAELIAKILDADVYGKEYKRR